MPIQVTDRHWKITDANGRLEEVRGPGIVGEQPVLKPGDVFRYTSALPADDAVGLHGRQLSRRRRWRIGLRGGDPDVFARLALRQARSQLMLDARDDTATIAMLEELVAFDTVSSKTNLPLIERVEAYLKGLGIASTRVPNAAGDKAAPARHRRPGGGRGRAAVGPYRRRAGEGPELDQQPLRPTPRGRQALWARCLRHEGGSMRSASPCCRCSSARS